MSSALQPHLAVVPPSVREPDSSTTFAGTSGPPQGQYLDNPVLTDWRSTDSVSRLREILVGHERGTFTESALLVDEMLRSHGSPVVAFTHRGFTSSRGEPVSGRTRARSWHP